MTRPDGVLHSRDSIKPRFLCQQTISSVSDDNMLGGLSVLAGRWGNYQPELLSQKTMSSEEHRGTNGISVRRLILSRPRHRASFKIGGSIECYSGNSTTARSSEDPSRHPTRSTTESLLQKTISHGISFESSFSNDDWRWKRNQEIAPLIL
jgi:hypothetical protein